MCGGGGGGGCGQTLAIGLGVATLAAGGAGLIGLAGAGAAGAGEAAAAGGLGALGATEAGAGLGTGLFTAGEAGAGLGSLGAAEGALGGSALFGAGAGTGTALGGAAASLGGAGLGAGLGGAGLGMADLGSLGTASEGLGGGAGLFTAGGELGAGGQGLLTAGINPADVGMNGTSALGGAANPTGITAPNALSGGVAPSDLGTATGMTPGYSPNAAAFGPNVPVPESGALSGSTGLSAEGSQIAAGPAGSFTQPSTLDMLLSPVRQGVSSLNSALSPVGGLSGVNNILRVGSGINTLASAFAGMGQTRALANAQNQQLSQINQLFAPDSAYAQQLAKQLAARDAAQGRNSQYGTRAVELAAALTQAKANALNSYNYSSLNTNAARNTSGTLNSLFGGVGQILGSGIAGGASNQQTTSAGVPNVMLNYSMNGGQY